MNREELIEEAAKALEAYDALYRNPRTGEYIIDGDEARVAADLAAVVQAHTAHAKPFDTSPERAKNGADFSYVTPTDDEREALRRVIEPYFDRAVDYNDGTRDDEGLADAILAAGFRRTVQGEPALIECPHWSPGKITMRKGCTACAAVQGEYGGAAPPDADERSHVRAVLQGEPTDAQVQRVREAIFAQSQRERQHPDGRAGLYYPSIEAAEAILRAAAATQEGENRG